MSKSSSIRFRLMAANILVKQIVIVLAGIYLLHAFDQIFRHEISDQLNAEARRLAALWPESGSAAVPAKQPQVLPAFGHWQISKNGEPVAGTLALNAKTLLSAANLEARRIEGPGGQALFGVVRTFDMRPDLVFVTAVDEAYISAVDRGFRNALVLALGGIAALLLTSAWIQMNVGLRPAEMLRKSIERVRLGFDNRIGPGFPDELSPLINEANRLLEAQETTVARARARAGDLAHGLKTPLTAMSVITEQLREDGNTAAAAEISKQLETMSHHVYRELTRTRIAASSGLSFNTNLSKVVERVQHTILRLPKADDLDWLINADADAAAAVEEDDAIELMANLLDNARKWARSCVQLGVSQNNQSVTIEVEDDGPGVQEAKRAQILARGIRLDESVPGTGLGLTIVKDIVDAYGGEIALYEAPAGGLGVRVMLPAASSQTEQQGATGQEPQALHQEPNKLLPVFEDLKLPGPQRT